MSNGEEFYEKNEGTEKPASNACVYTHRRNRRFPLSRKPAFQCLLVRCPNPRKSQQSVIWIADSSSRIAYPSPRRKRHGSLASSLVLSPQSHGFAGSPCLRLRDFANRFQTVQLNAVPSLFLSSRQARHARSLCRGNGQYSLWQSAALSCPPVPCGTPGITPFSLRSVRRILPANS